MVVIQAFRIIKPASIRCAIIANILKLAIHDTIRDSLYGFQILVLIHETGFVSFQK